MNCEVDTSNLLLRSADQRSSDTQCIVLGNGRIGQASRTECAVRGAYLGLNLSINGRVTDAVGDKCLNEKKMTRTTQELSRVGHTLENGGECRGPLVEGTNKYSPVVKYQELVT